MATKYKGTPAEKQTLDLFIKFMRAHDSLENRIRRDFQNLDLTPAQFGVLETLYYLGPLKQCELASKLLTTAGNITRLLDTLQKIEYIERLPEPGDRRSFRIHLTARGKKLLEKIFPKFLRSIQGSFNCLTTDEKEQLNHLLRKLGTHIKHSLNE
ncbi:MAG: HTH-type transcriptional regulator MhqR [Turneriella sp.]|nr:HTH-type transcriptional regulator MhqR [Turneriella sp.]